MVNKRVLIIGAGNGGKQLLRELTKHHTQDFQIIGFVDDDKRKHKKIIKDVRVIGPTQDLEKYIDQHKINLVFIAFPSVHGSVIRSIVARCNKTGVECRIIPKMLEIIQNKVSLNLVRPVAIEDLVGRPIIKSDQAIFETFLKNKKILITGAAGSIGSELMRQVSEFSIKRLIAFDSWETGLFDLEQELKSKSHLEKNYIIGNVQDVNKLEWTYKKFKPDVVFHAAAYKHVHIMNLNPEEAIKNNIVGTNNVASLAGKYDVKKFIFISTDKAVHPLGIMGASKAYGEALIMHYQNKFKTRYSAVRFGNVLGSYGSVVPLFKKQIAAGGPVTVTHPDMTRYFMTIPEAVQLILHAATLGKGGEIHVLDMGEPMKIMDLAKTMITLSGLEIGKDINIEITGIRPGEKLNEQLFTEHESLMKTSHNLIFETKNIPTLKDEELITSYKKLVKYATAQARLSLVKELKRIFPTLKEHAAVS